MSSKHSYLALLIAVTCLILLIVGALGVDEVTTPLLRRPGFLQAYRIGYASGALCVVTLLAITALKGPPFKMVAAVCVGLLAGYVGGLLGNIALSFVLGNPWGRVASIFRQPVQNSPTLFGFFLLTPLLSPSWLWTGMGTGLGALIANRVWRLSKNRSECNARADGSGRN